MSEPFIGQIILFAGNFAPTGWFMCQGQTLAISSYAALFSILGTTYGGNGTTTFQLPDLRSRVPVGWGQGPGLSAYVLGEQGGVENVNLLVSNMPSHTHLVTADASNGNATSPSNALLAQTVVSKGSTTYDTYVTGTPAHAVTMNPTTIQPQGGGIPHTNLQPFLGLNYIMAYVGIFPSRN